MTEPTRAAIPLGGGGSVRDTLQAKAYELFKASKYEPTVVQANAPVTNYSALQLTSSGLGDRGHGQR